MKLIGEKKKNLVWSYVASLILGIILLCCGLMSTIFEDRPYILEIFGIIIIIMSLIFIIDVANAPNEVIYYDEANKCILINNKKEIIYLKNIKNIRYKQARSKHSYYKFGHIYIEANNQMYKCKHVINCEDVCFFLHEKIIKAKNEIC